MNAQRRKIRVRAEERGISRLVHFTALENIHSIVKHGLMSRSELLSKNLRTRTSAPKRIDRLQSAISLSIERPNFGVMKAKYKRIYDDVAWVLLHLDPEILWTYKCRFAYTNAAKAEILHGGAMDGYQAFEDMFTRRGRNVPFIVGDKRPMSHPLDPQAEVQVLESIPARHIIGAEVWGYRVAVAVDDAFKSLPGAERNVECQSNGMYDFSPHNYDPPGYGWRHNSAGAISYAPISVDLDDPNNQS